MEVEGECFAVHVMEVREPETMGFSNTLHHGTGQEMKKEHPWNLATQTWAIMALVKK